MNPNEAGTFIEITLYEFEMNINPYSAELFGTFNPLIVQNYERLASIVQST